MIFLDDLFHAAFDAAPPRIHRRSFGESRSRSSSFALHLNGIFGSSSNSMWAATTIREYNVVWMRHFSVAAANAVVGSADAFHPTVPGRNRSNRAARHATCETTTPYVGGQRKRQKQRSPIARAESPISLQITPQRKFARLHRAEWRGTNVLVSLVLLFCGMGRLGVIPMHLLV